MSKATEVQVGEVVRVPFAFLGDDETLTSPSSITITIQHPPTDPATADDTVASPDPLITLGATDFPPTVRKDLARQFAAYDIPESAFVGAGCVEYLHTPLTAGNYWFKGVTPEGSVAEVKLSVREQFT